MTGHEIERVLWNVRPEIRQEVAYAIELAGVEVAGASPSPPSSEGERWREIASAPTDGSEILLLSDEVAHHGCWQGPSDGAIYSGSPGRFNWFSRTCGQSLHDDGVTHWAPLPLPTSSEPADAPKASYPLSATEELDPSLTSLKEERDEARGTDVTHVTGDHFADAGKMVGAVEPDWKARAQAAEQALSALKGEVVEKVGPFVKMARLIESKFYAGDKSDGAVYHSGGAWREADGSVGTLRIGHFRALSTLYDKLKGPS